MLYVVIGNAYPNVHNVIDHTVEHIIAHTTIVYTSCWAIILLSILLLIQLSIHHIEHANACALENAQCSIDITINIELLVLHYYCSITYYYLVWCCCYICDMLAQFEEVQHVAPWLCFYQHCWQRHMSLSPLIWVGLFAFCFSFYCRSLYLDEQIW